MKKMHKINELINKIRETVDSHSLGKPGEYARRTIPSGDRYTGLNEYGCADAANILYTLCEFPSDFAERAAWTRTLQSFQKKESGMFSEATHSPLHTTAHCTAALELFEEKPLYRFNWLEAVIKEKGIEGFLNELDWSEDPWSSSHSGAGVYAALKNAGFMTYETEERYFQWLWNEADPETGLWRKGYVKNGEAPVYYHLASTFHYLFNHEFACRGLRYPEKMVDTCLDMYYGNMLRENFGKTISFLEVDWIYCLNRASRRSGYRHADVRSALERFADDFIDYLYSVDVKSDLEWDDLHNLFGTLCALAELQNAVCDCILTEKPLRLVLDRRPFI